MRAYPETHEQIVDTYRRMATEGGYRPAAPSDGFGGITVPLDQLDLDEEAERYAGWWWEEEDDGQFAVGYCDYATRPATIYAIEAARSLCGCAPDVALRLLRMAVADLEATPRVALRDIV